MDHQTGDEDEDDDDEDDNDENANSAESTRRVHIPGMEQPLIALLELKDRNLEVNLVTNSEQHDCSFNSRTGEEFPTSELRKVKKGVLKHQLIVQEVAEGMGAETEESQMVTVTAGKDVVWIHQLATDDLSKKPGGREVTFSDDTLVPSIPDRNRGILTTQGSRRMRTGDMYPQEAKRHERGLLNVIMARVEQEMLQGLEGELKDLNSMSIHDFASSMDMDRISLNEFPSVPFKPVSNRNLAIIPIRAYIPRKEEYVLGYLERLDRELDEAKVPRRLRRHLMLKGSGKGRYVNDTVANDYAFIDNGASTSVVLRSLVELIGAPILMDKEGAHLQSYDGVCSAPTKEYTMLIVEVTGVSLTDPTLMVVERFLLMPLIMDTLNTQTSILVGSDITNRFMINSYDEQYLTMFRDERQILVRRIMMNSLYNKGHLQLSQLAVLTSVESVTSQTKGSKVEQSVMHEQYPKTIVLARSQSQQHQDAETQQILSQFTDNGQGGVHIPDVDVWNVWEGLLFKIALHPQERESSGVTECTGFDLGETLVTTASGELFPRNERDWKFGIIML